MAQTQLGYDLVFFFQLFDGLKKNSKVQKSKFI